MMADDRNYLCDQQDHIEYLELPKVWKSIGLSLEDKVIQEWSEQYPVNIAVLDSGIKENHEAFQSKIHPAPKVLKSKSFVVGDDASDVTGHGTFCAGVAAGYPIPSPKKIKDPNIQEYAERFCKFQKLSDGSRGVIEDIFQGLSGSGSENLPFVGVAPFAKIISYKVIDDNDDVDENALADAMQDLVKYNNSVEFKDKVHIVSMSLSAHYNEAFRTSLYDVLNSDMIVVAAACNMGQRNNYCNGNIWFPARFGNVISVGSHDNHGQPSKMSSVGREVDFLAPGEDIWGPAISEDDHGLIEKDEGTSMSAAIVSGIVALVLAFVHKEKGLDARAMISNNPVMKEIIGNMATRRGQHDKVEGYGNLKPFSVFGYGAHVLWSLLQNLSSASPQCSDGAENSDFNAKVSKFILGQTALAMHSPKNKVDVQNVTGFYPYINHKASYPYNYHEDKDKTEIKPCSEDCLMKSTLDALSYLKQRKLTSHVEVINLILPVLSLTPSQNVMHVNDLPKLLMCQDVLPIILESEVQVIEQLIFPKSIADIYASDLCRFIKSLPAFILSGLKSIVVPSYTPLGVLCRIAEILNGQDVTIYAETVNAESFESTEQKCEFPPIIGVKVITPDSRISRNLLQELHERAGFVNPLNMIYVDPITLTKVLKEVEKTGLISDDETNPTGYDFGCVDEILVMNDSQNYCDVKTFYSSVCFSDSELSETVTVAVLGDAININHKEVNGNINPESNLKCFTVPSGGTVENVRYLGTLCASIIAGESEGIAPFVDLVYATVINAEAQTKPEWVISALEWIERKHSDVDIVVIPLGFAEFNLDLFKIINRLSKSMVVVCAAGSSPETIRPANISYPARYGDVICVGSHSASSLPSSFSPQGREIDLLAIGDNVALEYFSVDENLVEESYLLIISYPQVIPIKHSLSGTCVAVACAARVIAQIVSFALHCGFKRQQITNNTVMRELLKHLTCNFSHDPRSGHGWLNDPSKSVLFQSPDYFKKVVEEILPTSSED